jgi:hypothetical protein
MGDVIQSGRNGNGLIARIEFLCEMGRVGNFSAAALLVALNLLYRHLNGTTGRCDPAIATLAEETGLQERSVKRAIAELQESGWWIVGRNEGTAGRGGRPNTYRPNLERGDQTGKKGVTNESPKPVKNQEEDSHTCDRSATAPV